MLPVIVGCLFVAACCVGDCCSLCVARRRCCSLFVAGCVLFVVWCLCVVCCLLFVVVCCWFYHV